MIEEGPSRGPRMLRLERYAFAVVAVGAALLYKLLLAPVLDQPDPFLLFALAVLASAWRGGLGPGLLAAVLSVGTADYFLLEPRFSFGFAESGQAVRLALFAFECLAVAALGARAQRTVRALGDPERTRTADEARARAERHRALLDAGPAAVIATDDAGAITFWNARAARLLGWTEDDVRGRDLAELILPAGEREAWRAERERMRTAPASAPARRFERRVLRRDRSEVPVDATLDARRTDAGWEFTLFLVDLSERQRTDEARWREAERQWGEALAREQQARREAEADARLRDEFMATLSHELRTPLSAIVGWAHLLRSGNLEDKDRARAVETIDRSAKSQAQLIADVLDVSSIVTGKLRITLQPVGLRAVVESAVETVRPAADAKGVRVEYERGEEATVDGDPNRLQQVVLNLLSNAVKFTPAGGAVHVRLATAEGEALIEVRDEGKGIAPGFLPHVFERYRQAEDGGGERGQGGLGLGLAIVSHLVELHGGRVEAQSEGEGHGAVFTVRLPLLAAAADERRAPVATAAGGEGAEPSLQGVRVLVVDDDDDVRGMMQTVLSERGADVRTAASGGEALDAARREPPDVVVSDLAMPEMDGYTLLKELRGQTPRIPAAAVTAYARPEDRRQALLAGFQMHVAKPIEPGELVAVVASLAGKT
jgi:PAS domain S-box-containing protein